MPVRITVKSGTCSGAIHAPGQEFEVDETTPAGICLGAWESISASVNTLLYGGNFPWEKEKGVATVHCPDPDGIILEIKRVASE